MGKVLEAQEEMGKPILWGMGWVNSRLGIFGGHPLTSPRFLRYDGYIMRLVCRS